MYRLDIHVNFDGHDEIFSSYFHHMHNAKKYLSKKGFTIKKSCFECYKNKRNDFAEIKAIPFND